MRLRPLDLPKVCRMEPTHRSTLTDCDCDRWTVVASPFCQRFLPVSKCSFPCLLVRVPHTPGLLCNLKVNPTAHGGTRPPGKSGGIISFTLPAHRAVDSAYFFLHSHGGTGCGSAHKPFLASRACFSSFSSSASSGAYFRYHQRRPLSRNLNRPATAR